MSSSQQSIDERNNNVKSNAKRSILKTKANGNNDLKAIHPDLDHSLNLTSQKMMDYDSQDNTNTRLNRRVSFAPDVTLHSFNFVGKEKNEIENESMDLTEPMEVSSTTPNNINLNASNVNSSSNIIVSSQNNESEEMDFTERQEKLSPILLPILDNNNDDDKESTMELTETNFESKNNKEDLNRLEITQSYSNNGDPPNNTLPPVGDIQNNKIPLIQDSNEDEMELTEINPFDAEKVPVPNEGTKYESPQMQEQQSMDFTQVHNNPLNENRTEQKNTNSQVENNEDTKENSFEAQEQSMELTQLQKTETSNNDTNADSISNDNQISLTEIKTQPVKNTHLTTLNITNHNENIENDMIADEQMELTQVIPKSVQENKPVPHNTSMFIQTKNTNNVDEETMQFTQVQKQDGILKPYSMFAHDFSKAKINEKSSTKSNDIVSRSRKDSLQNLTNNIEDDINNQMELTQIYSAKRTLDDNEMELTEIQSVKRALNDDATMYRTPEKKLKITQEETSDMDLTQAEKMSPIKIEQFENNYDTNNENNSNDTNKNNSNDIDQNDDTNIESDNNDIKTNKNSPIILLNDFIEEIGFLTNQSILQPQPKKIQFPSIRMSNQKKGKIFDLYNCFYGELPFLQMSAFSCMEILKTNDESRRSFQDLQRQISSSSFPPLLLKEYSTSDNDIKISMIEQLKLVKSYSMLMAKKSLYKWQLSHFDNIEKVLSENLNVLNTINDELVNKYNEIKEIYNKINEIKKSLKDEINALQNKPEEVTIARSVEKKIKLQILRRYLQIKNLKSSELSQLSGQRKKIELDIEMLTSRLALNGKKSRQFKDIDDSVCDKLHFYRNISGLKLNKVNGSIICVGLSSMSHISFNIDLTETCEQFSSRIRKSTFDCDLVKILLQEIIDKNYNPTLLIKNVITYLLHDLIGMEPILDCYYILQLLFVTRITKENEIEFDHYQFDSEIAVTFSLSLLNLKNLVNGKSTEISATVNNGSNVSQSILQEQFTTKCQNLLPNLKGIKISII